MKRNHRRISTARLLSVTVLGLALLDSRQTLAQTTASTPAGPRPSVVIVPFDYSAVRGSVAAIFGTDVNVGQGIRALLTTRIQQQGKVRLLEGDLAKVQDLLDAQDRNQSDRNRRGSGARMGRMEGADFYLMGDIVIFGRDDKRKTINTRFLCGYLLPCPGPLAGGADIGSSQGKAVIAINYRLVNAETGEIAATGEARGESAREGKIIGVDVASMRGAGYGAVDMTSSNYAATIIGEATINACDKLAVMIGERSAASVTFREIEGKVAAVNGGTVTINRGASDYVQVGDRFDVSKVLSEIKDPDTGEKLDETLELLGVLTITQVRDRVAVGQYEGKPAVIGSVARKRQ